MRKIKVNGALAGIILLRIIFINSLALAENKTESESEDANKLKEAVVQSRTVIESDSLEMDPSNKGYVFRFISNVVVKGNDLHMTCQQLEVFSNRNDNNETATNSADYSGLDDIGEIEHIVATGDVVIIQDNKKALADRAEILCKRDNASGKKISNITLTGNPRVIDEQGTITGARIILIPEEDKVLIESDPALKERPTIILNKIDVNPIDKEILSGEEKK